MLFRSLEALLGYLYLTGDTLRMDEVIANIIGMLDGHSDSIDEKEMGNE